MKRLKKVCMYLNRTSVQSNFFLFRPPVLFAAARAATMKGVKNKVNSGLSDE